MKFRLLLICACIFTFFSTSHASPVTTESIFSGSNEKNQKIYVLLYLEGKIWHLDEIVQHPDGWQDLVSRRYFSNFYEAHQHHLVLQKNYVNTQVLQPLAETPTAELSSQGGVLWTATKSWNWEWEKKYAQWLDQTMDTDFFKKHGIATDCADVAYGARWIFARIHGLPAANRLAGSGSLMTNHSLRAEWAKIPTVQEWHQDRRFLAALNYLMNMTYTHSLMRDSYPVAITPDNFLPGIHHLDLGESSGHTQLVHRVDLSEDGLIPFHIVESTVPRKLRTLNESIFWGSQPAEKGKRGFLRILWPKITKGVFSLENPEKMPGYSLEQFSSDFIREKDRSNNIEVMLRLKPDLDFVEILRSGYQNLKEMFQARLAVVEEGFQQCQIRSCPPNSPQFDTWSTPSRDKKIENLISQIMELLTIPLSEDVRQKMKLVTNTELNSIALTLAQEDYTLNSLIFAWTNLLYSSDPNDPPEVRWGVSPSALSQRFQKNLEKLLPERLKKINKQNDHTLKSDYIISQKYCDFFSYEQCLRIRNQELKRTIRINGQVKPLEAWLEQAFWLNSDNSQSLENQWGALRAQSKFQPLPAGLKKFFVSVDGIGFMEFQNGQKRLGIMGANGLEDAGLPDGFRWQYFNRAQSEGWASAPGQLLKFEFKNQNQSLHQMPFQENGHILILKDQIAVLKTQNSLWMIDLRDPLTSQWKIDTSEAHAISENLIVALKNGTWFLYDFSTSNPIETKTDLNLKHAAPFIENDRGIGIRLKNSHYFIEKSTGKITDLSHLNTPLLWSKKLSKAVFWKANPNGLYLATLNSDFQIISSVKIGDFGWASGEYLFAGTISDGLKSYQMQDESLVHHALMKDEEFFVDGQLPWVTTKIKDKNDFFRIRKIDSKNAIYEGTMPVMRGTQRDMDWVFILDKDSNSESESRLISTLNHQEPALMTGRFFESRRVRFLNSALTYSIERGLVTWYQDFPFWVEF